MQNFRQFSEMDRIQFNLNFIKSDPEELYPQFYKRLFNAIWFLTPLYLKTLTVKDVIIWYYSESLSQWKHYNVTQKVFFIFLFYQSHHSPSGTRTIKFKNEKYHYTQKFCKIALW